MKTRSEREQLYIQRETELQRRWKNPSVSDWGFVKGWSDEELEQRIEDTSRQLGFERRSSFTAHSILYVVGGFIVLGVIGLLVFGIRQL